MPKPKKKKVIFRGTLADAAHYGELDYDASIQVGVAVYARQRECYLNALRASSIVDASEVLYVEGYAFLSTLPGLGLEHGWLLCDGKIIDPTHAAHQGGDERLAHYRPVIVWSVNDMLLQAVEQQCVPLSMWPTRWEAGSLTPEEVAKAWRTAFLEPFGDVLAAEAPELLKLLEL